MIRRLLLVFVVLVTGVFAGSTSAQADTCQSGMDYLAQAQVAVESGAYTDALASYTCALQADPLNDQARIGRLQTALMAGDYLTAYGDAFLLNDGAYSVLASAIEAQSTLLSADPDNVDAYQVRAFLYLFSGQPDAATADAGAIIERNPDHVLAHVIQAAAYDMMGDADNAASAFETAVTLSPDNAQVYGLMAAAQWAAFNIEGMAANSSRAIELAPKLAHPYRLYGMTQIIMGNPEDVFTNANQAIELDPTYYAFYLLRATSYQMQGDPQSALNDLNRAIDLNPRSINGYGIRVGAQMALGNMDAAAQDFAMAVELGTVETVEGAALVAGEPVVVTMTAGRTYRLPFEASAGQSVTITVTSVNPGEVDSLALVVGPDETPLAFNDDVSDENLDAAITDFTIPEDGTYMLVVSHANFGSEGDIEISLDLK